MIVIERERWEGGRWMLLVVFEGGFGGNVGDGCGNGNGRMSLEIGEKEFTFGNIFANEEILVDEYGEWQSMTGNFFLLLPRDRCCCMSAGQNNV